jgi:hypothetical protein
MLLGDRVASALRAAIRLLTFRSPREELLGLDTSHLILGLATTWLVGMGRYWHVPHASWVQRVGFASLLYVGALSLALWVICLPLRPEAWSFRRTLTFVSLLSPPAALQAIPLRDFADYSQARVLGAWLLGAITLWRAALLIWFLVRSARLRPLEAFLSVLLPLDLIVIALSHFQVRHEIGAFVNGFRSFDLLESMALLGLPIPLFAYVGVVVSRLIAHRRRVKALAIGRSR